MDPTVLDSKTSLLMATRNGAEILGIGKQTGTIKKGKRADLVIAGLYAAHLVPVYDIYSHITYCMRPSDIETVMVNGKILIDNRKPLTLVENDILSKAKIWQARISGQ
jgi:5-methylthioadenosine/S-adenosylhomocysteine deaminase